jgi:HAD superfamily phosphoserine phosphatase-like hydrolase
MAATPAFATVILDVDSTVSGIEGIDWLARLRGDVVARRVASLTNDAMRGAIPLDEVYAARLAASRPRRHELDALAAAYVDAIAPGCVETISRLSHAGVRVVLVSSGLRHALIRLALHLGVELRDLHAVDIRFDAGGAYAGFDTGAVHTTAAGKRKLIASLTLERPILMAGDGVTDAAARNVVDCFAAFTGFVEREAVVDHAQARLASFAELADLVLP